jgi:hypothetical protein
LENPVKACLPWTVPVFINIAQLPNYDVLIEEKKSFYYFTLKCQKSVFYIQDLSNLPPPRGPVTPNGLLSNGNSNSTLMDKRGHITSKWKLSHVPQIKCTQPSYITLCSIKPIDLKMVFRAFVQIPLQFDLNISFQLYLA